MKVDSNIHILQKFCSEDFQILEQYSQVAVLIDENTKRYCLPLLEIYLKNITLIEIKSGEIYKTLDTCKIIWAALTAQQFDRQGLLLNLGGGVIGDMGGFCATTYKRGISFIQIPTTLLAQVDASIGGKLGVDFQGYKNHIGVFHPPLQVWIHPFFLKTLPKRQLLSGLAEIIKHSLIADIKQWSKLVKQNVNNYDWVSFIPDSIAVKKRITEQDPREILGIRQALNFGHTIGHAVERFFLGHPTRHLLHGEAIVVGMICEAFLSWQHHLLSQSEFKAICNYLYHIYSKAPIYDSEIKPIVENVLQDKKNKGQNINCVLLKGIGRFITDCKVSREEIEESLRYYIL